MKLSMWPWHIPKKVYVKFQKIPFTNKFFTNKPKGEPQSRSVKIAEIYSALILLFDKNFVKAPFFLKS